MPKMDAVSKRNCAITVQLDAPTWWVSSIITAVKAKATAARNEPTAIAFSVVRFCLSCNIHATCYWWTIEICGQTPNVCPQG